MVYNALAAWSVGKLMGLEGNVIAGALEKFTAPGMRMEILVKDGVRYINDAYNANPLSMRAAADVLKTIMGDRKIAVLGDMLELGNRSEESHKTVGRLFGSIGLEKLILVGENADFYYYGAREGGMNPETIEKCPDVETAIKIIDSLKRPGDIIFIKGSRAVGMEKVVHSVCGVN
jgi:UDP-N-acetylmuramoyl-tripeptide--D-alanyl-D-alanine ligase